ncbi:carbohydrate-binding protein [Embleya sp. NPDC001921]
MVRRFVPVPAAAASSAGLLSKLSVRFAGATPPATTPPTTIPPSTVPPSTRGTTAWERAAIYVANNSVSHKGHAWKAKWWTQGEEPGTTGQWGVWQDLGAC